MTEQETSQLIAVLLIEFLILVAPLLFILADLKAGIRKAKQRHEKITSRKWRATINKIAKYYNVLLVLGILDVMQLACLWYMNTYGGWSAPLFPWLTFLGSVFVGLIETKSIMEPADEKEEKQLREVSVLAKAIIDHRTDPNEIAKAVVDFMKQETTE